MVKKLGAIFSLTLACFSTTAQQHSYGEDLANTAIKIWPDSFSVVPGNPAKWSYDQGVILKGMEGIWQRTGDGRWFNYIQ